MLDFQKNQKINSDGIYESAANEDMLSYLLLAYDLYTIDHNYELQDRVIKRLKDENQFQGALYELYIASLFMRAGFEIEYSDESDYSQKHPEFIAKLSSSDQFIAVEAKSKHRESLIGRKGTLNGKFRLNITKSMNRAFHKEVDMPYIIFIDINLPAEKKHYAYVKKQLNYELKKSYENLAISNKFNLIFFTDHHPYSTSNNSAASIFFKKPIYLTSSKPKYVIEKQNIIIGRILKSISQYGNIPNSFSDLDPYDSE